MNALDARLLLLYDQYALINLLQYWHMSGAMLFGRPARFWKRAQSDARHPFFKHPLLSRFGGTLADAGRKRALDRCKEKGVTRLPILFSFQVVDMVARLKEIEGPHRTRLVQLAKLSAAEVWGIPIDMLDGALGKATPFGTPIRIRNSRAAAFRACMVGLGGVEQRNSSLVVVGRATNWQLLTKELVKGTAELICLHGLNSLSDEMYRMVTDTADRIEYEPWMLQTGGELWRRFLAAAPEGRPLAPLLMHMARLPPMALESLMQAVIEQQPQARCLLAGLGEEGELSSSE
jgi:hypothetical protein